MALALGVQALLGAQGTVTLGCGELPGCLQPGLVLPIQRLPLPGRVLAGLPGLLPGAGFGLPGQGQFGLGSADRCRGPVAGLIAFGPCGLSDPAASAACRPARARAASASARARATSSASSRLAWGGLLMSAAGLGFGDPGRFQRREHLLPGLGGTRLRGDRARLSAAPGRFGLRHLRGHHLRVQRMRLLPMWTVAGWVMPIAASGTRWKLRSSAPSRKYRTLRGERQPGW